MSMPSNTLVLLVTCSLDATREDLAVQVVKNLCEKLPEAGLDKDFILFDNASTFSAHLHHVSAGARVIRSPQNVGYWSAIKWVLNNARDLMGRTYKYIYIVESDLYHTDLRALADCEKFLDDNEDAACVRTQEFSVRSRWRFDKALQFLPFHVGRSEIRLQNLVTNQRAWFKATSIPKLYKSNLHAKLPALNRFDVLREIFDILTGYDVFSEWDFFAEVAKKYDAIGVYDGGIFYSLFSYDDKKTVMSGSYSNAAQLSQTGYQQTRKSKIVDVPANLEISKAA